MFEKLMGRLDPEKNSRVFKAVSTCHASSCTAAHSTNSKSKKKNKDAWGICGGLSG